MLDIQVRFLINLSLLLLFCSFFIIIGIINIIIVLMLPACFLFPDWMSVMEWFIKGLILFILFYRGKDNIMDWMCCFIISSYFYSSFLLKTFIYFVSLYSFFSYYYNSILLILFYYLISPPFLILKPEKKEMRCCTPFIIL